MFLEERAEMSREKCRHESLIDILAWRWVKAEGWLGWQSRVVKSPGVKPGYGRLHYCILSV